ncbi:MAG: dinitrogenase iron-molybdenum cofactor biosynthesis protein [Gracilibacteraceae bacterium]|jgi:predicted Fe-Mo cluster-binding NifX family protein|nr:dinitrogenase iron-molybdenum cofactor biosynthesis protein [Gracilibacteraceae bacterium]
MTRRVALASSDGKVIDRHFGQAEEFYIVDLLPEENSFHFVERRQVDAACRGGEHDPAAFDRILALLEDCADIIVSRIGTGAAVYMRRCGKRVLTQPGFIEDVLAALLKYEARVNSKKPPG